ncbi:MAG: DUF2235 domain-containing protein, partial [Thiotrichaceae bacterium]|nr:DUF2235 domain-containing protein [Thiotrichaceae bacterium]
MELGETSASATIEVEEIKEKAIEHVTIRLSVFFDGTLNNRINIDHRVANTAVYQKNKESGSYESDYTNVEKIERYLETSEDEEYDTKLAIYIEGPGTENEEGDATRGFAIGTGATGVKKKVEKGLVEAVKTITENVAEESIIDKLTLDVVGFSRGAAGARNFIFEALKEPDSIRQWLEERERPVKKIVVHFAGLFDTVSSHGLSFSNDTRTLKLDAIRKAEKVVHLVAAEEHRKNFSLTNIKSAGTKGLEIYLPGVHSDVGGSYRDASEEDMVVYKARRESEASAERERLIAAGWYRADEITLKQVRSKIGRATVHLQVKRSGIRHHYSRIPLHIMARFARESG